MDTTLGRPSADRPPSLSAHPLIRASRAFCRCPGNLYSLVGSSSGSKRITCSQAVTLVPTAGRRQIRRVRTTTVSIGCGSSGGASRRVRNDVAGVAGLVDAVAFLGEVVAPVVFEVAVAAKRAEPEDGLGTAESPEGAGEVHPVFDQVAAGAFDDPGGDRPAFRQRGRVVQVPGLVGQVGGAG